ncbi:hypothetical protein R1flu_028214 [Riccia fluitans]|uniref:Uncharacterized protein n=1 Tax=Riccia fluitans TaxID=41844 RepID=A0ABD1XP07_9MARC
MWTLYPNVHIPRCFQEEASRKRPRFESNPKDSNERNLPSAVILDSSHMLEAPVVVYEVVMETSQKGKEKVIESLHLPNVDIAAEERRRLKIGMKASCLEMDPLLSTPTRQTSGRGNNHIAPDDTTKEVPPTSSKLPSDGIMEESVNQMTTMLSNTKATIQALERRKAR